jgi:hypothetical protein
MSDKKSSWSKDSDNLLKLAVAEDAVNQVWGKFEKALAQLDSESLALFREYLDGVPVTQLSERRGLTTEQTKDWLDQVKREINQSLRANCKVRQ